MADIKIVQYPDQDGNRAYAYTHWQGIDGIPDSIKTIAKNGVPNTGGGGAGSNYYDNVTLASSGGSYWKLGVDDSGKLTTSATTANSGMSSLTFSSPSGYKYLIKVNDDGRLTTERL